MELPQNHRNHVLERKSVKFFNQCMPDEWVVNEIPNDYGIDLSVEICINNQLTGLNFSVQLKSTERAEHELYAKPLLEKSTLNYLRVRLEPTMLVMYDASANEAYWSWISDFEIDYKNLKATRTFLIPKLKTLGEMPIGTIISHVEHIFNAKSFLSDADITKIKDDDELKAWAAYYHKDYEQSAYLFGRLVIQKGLPYSAYQALAWSYYYCFRYKKALSTINRVIEIDKTRESLLIKACIMAEYGASDGDRSKVLQARNIFYKYLGENDGAEILYNYGNTFFSLGAWEEAKEQYLKSLEKNSVNAECLKNLGTTYYHLNDHERELECYKRALEIKPYLTQALFSKGVTLAQVFKQYEDALILFNQVLSTGNDLVEQYVSGLYWVATCYEEVGDLEMALKWINKGLEYEGENVYLLQFKTNLLGRHWTIDTLWRDRAIEFFHFRIELSKDNLSIYHLIEIYSFDIAQTVDFLKNNTILYRDIELEHLIQLGVKLEDVKETLIYMPHYGKFRQTYILQRYVDQLISPYYSITSNFWNLLDVIFCIGFGRSVEVARSNDDVVAHGESLYNSMIAFMPGMVNFLVPEDNYEGLDIVETASALIPRYLDMIHREIGAQSGYITSNLNLRTVDPDEYFTDDDETLLIDEVSQHFYIRLAGNTEL